MVGQGARNRAMSTAAEGRRDIRLLFVARSVRMFGYGLLAVVLVLYLDASGLSGAEIGLLLALTLLGDVLISLWLTTHADRLGRRRVLVLGAVLLLAGRPRRSRRRPSSPPAGRRHRRRHQPQRQRGGALPGRRAGRR